MWKCVLIVLACLALPAMGCAQGVATAGLVADWRMEVSNGSIVLDFSEAGNHGLLVGEAVPVFDPEMGSAIEIFGGTGAIVIPHHPSLEPATGTVEVWVKVKELTNADIISKVTYRMLRSGVDGGFQVYGLRIAVKGYAYGFVADDLPGKHWWTLAYAGQGRLLEPAGWRLLGMRWDGKLFTVFVDGQRRGSQTYTPVPELGLSYHHGSPVYIAVPSMWSGAVQDHFYGRIGRVRIYSRALSDEEIRAGFQAESPAFRH